jgi:MoaA/NifB/PqqE/SkfB family radical SAM enzyme
MSNLPQNFCVAPFLQLTTHPSRSFSPCPYLGGTTWDIKHNSIQSIWNGAELEDLRQQFIDNKKSKICDRCWNEEKNNKKSLRIRLHDPVNKTTDYSVISPELIDNLKDGLAEKKYLKGPNILTIKNGNICNFKCRVCHPNDSSKWVSDANKLHDRLVKQFYAVGVVEANWTDDQIDEIFDLSENLLRLELFGGEPLFNKKIIKLLQRLIDSGRSSNLILYINTNGSVDVTSQIPELYKFKEVEIGVSLDDIGPRFEYQRHGGNYDQVIKNVRIWKEYFHNHKVKHSIDAITTVNIYNVFYLPEIKDVFSKLLMLSPFWNLLVSPAHLNIANMPSHLKDIVISRLKDDPEFADLIAVIQQPADDIAWQDFLTITRELDDIRLENFANTFPELYNAITTV